MGAGREGSSESGEHCHSACKEGLDLVTGAEGWGSPGGGIAGVQACPQPHAFQRSLYQRNPSSGCHYITSSPLAPQVENALGVSGTVVTMGSPQGSGGMRTVRSQAAFQEPLQALALCDPCSGERSSFPEMKGWVESNCKVDRY